jgi:5-methylcytosine-specific restriction endonuclease McrA
MYAYCLAKLHSEDSAAKHLQAARTARRFPILFPALAEGRLHLSAVVMLSPRLTNETANDLVAAATHKSKSEIAQLLAERFPRADVPTIVQPVPAAPEQLAARPVELSSQEHAPGHAAPHPRVTPLAPQRYALQLTMSQSTHDKLRHAQDLLGHQIPAGDVVQVLDRALDALIAKLEKRKFAATDKPRPQNAGSGKGRSIPAQVRRTVSQRDRRQCTFVGENGHRCEARAMLEFDHVREFARGGPATAENVRLRCRAHNQYTAEQTYGADLIRGKREEARRAAAETRERAEAAVQERAARERAAREKAEEVIPWLRALGIRPDEARRASARCESMPEASLEERVKAALSCFAPRDVALRRAAPA